MAYCDFINFCGGGTNILLTKKNAYSETILFILFDDISLPGVPKDGRRRSPQAYHITPLSIVG